MSTLSLRSRTNVYLKLLCLATFIVLIPFWIVNASWYHFVIAYMAYWFYTDIVESMFLHRWGAHGLWDPPVWLQNILATFSTLTLLGTPLTWAAWHRTHHAHTDTEKDPHSPKYRSAFYIVLMSVSHKIDFRRALDRARVPYFKWLTNYEGVLAFGFALLLFIMIPWIWFLTIWAIPVAVLGFMPGYCTNVVCHSYKKGVVRNVNWTWFFIFAEAFHKNHHDNNPFVLGPYDISAKLIGWLGWTKKNPRYA